MGEDVIRETKRAYGWPEDKSFYVPDGVLEHFRGAIEGRGKPLRDAWDKTLAGYRTAFPELAKEVDTLLSDKLPDGWDADIPDVRRRMPRASPAVRLRARC